MLATVVFVRLLQGHCYYRMMMARSYSSSSSSRRGTPFSRNRKVRGGGGVSIKPGSQPESEESHASSSEHSDNEDEGSQVRNQVL